MKKLNEYKQVLIVVDMLNGFIKDGILHDKSIENIVPKVKKIIEDSLRNNRLVIFIKDVHSVDSVEFKRFGDTSHCLKGTYESELIDELKCYEDMDNVLVVCKNSTSYMESPDFRDIIGELNNVSEVEVVGCCTDICVFNGTMGLSNYFNQWNKDVLITVYKDCIATFNEVNRQGYIYASYLLMEQQGIKLVGEYNGK